MATWWRVPMAKAAPHESSWMMVTPLVVLAGLSIVGGAINLPFLA